MIKKIEKLTMEEVMAIKPGETATFVLPSLAKVLSANSYLSRLRMMNLREDVETYTMETCRDTTVINITAIGYGTDAD